jgi:hypothetical protein
MREITGNLWDPMTWKLNGQKLDILFDAIAITTNGTVKKNGEGVLGRGCAKEAVEKWKKFNIPRCLGDTISRYGNNVAVLVDHRCNPIPYSLVSFPVKPESAIVLPDKSNIVPHMHKYVQPGQVVQGWASVAKLDIVARSAQQLMDLATRERFGTIILPRPGCNNGRLKWDDVKKILEKTLDDRVMIISFK